MHMEYKIYKSTEELETWQLLLLEKAVEATDLSYAPYSNFRVGAALLLDNEEIILGANQENVSYPLCMCAERVALYSKSINFPQITVKALAITARFESRPLSYPATPCGACRQVIREYEHRQKQQIQLILRGEDGPVYTFAGIEPLLPMGFDPGVLL